MQKKFTVKVDESFKYNFKSSDLNNLDLLKISNSKFHLIKNNKSYKIELLKSDFYKRVYTLKINSKIYNINIANQLDSLINEMGFSIGISKKSGDIKAPMPGLILNINVKEGQKVKEGDTLLVLEAMKMENAISAQVDGVVKSIEVKKGCSVEKGELMIQMD
ncbi:acetyl-CoA carboxylase biotin carboxyl carrier protein subunit [Lutibacter sp. B1]|uniref:acetyl-CoA carboxylase biotin carboxyl carrier protein subunit n=1 Tax=Lutibacter sp. B1 TaxID=2725996 RepID=UPI0014563241|nr:acetyl-CoA carboxylase biotin carboxyl carrier protein subunit [Lutibacter sp. B1]NLP58068.1 acetyl-CoA carboxylase biotin carboxyl carrier protein subunit [Lutibacter sp. B1]